MQKMMQLENQLLIMQQSVPSLQSMHILNLMRYTHYEMHMQTCYLGMVNCFSGIQTFVYGVRIRAELSQGKIHQDKKNLDHYPLFCLTEYDLLHEDILFLQFLDLPILRLFLEFHNLVCHQNNSIHQA